MLTLVPTPIGNMGDISFRALEVLKDGELILCEDTRVTKKLLHLLSSRYELKLPPLQFISVHSHNEKKFLEDTANIELLKEKNCIYMSDAGMPCISDPGASLVEYCLQNNLEFDVLPGSNALLTAFASSGFNETEFIFFGFLPHKGNDRKSVLNDVVNSTKTAILYESPHRLQKLLSELNEKIPNREMFLVKELTKKYQEKYKAPVSVIFNKLKDENIKGEWVVVIEKNKTQVTGSAITKDDILELELAPKQKAKLIAKLTGEKVKEIYNQLIQEVN